MIPALVALVLSQGVEPCGGVASCVRVGYPDGGQVQLGAVLQSSKYVTPDGGSAEVRVQPLTTSTPVSLLGNQGRFVNEPDVILGGTTGRDGGSQVIVRFRSGNVVVGELAGNGTLTVPAITASGSQSFGNVQVTGTLGVTGVSTLSALDAGARSKVSGITIAAAQAADGGQATPLCQFGSIALANGDAGIVFRSAFTSLPSCVLTHVAVTNANPCVISTAASTTAVGIGAQSAGTDVCSFICCGDL